MPQPSKIEVPDLDRLMDKRGDVRYGVSGLVPATVQASDGRDIEVVILDVSRGGLGLLANDCGCRVGDVLRLCIEGQEALDLVIRWTRSSRLGEGIGLSGMTRIGLAALAGQDNLLQRLEPFDCIDH